MRCKFCQCEAENDETYHRDDKHNKPIDGDIQVLCNSCQAEYVQDKKQKLVSLYQAPLGDSETRIQETPAILNSGLEMLENEQAGATA